MDFALAIETSGAFGGVALGAGGIVLARRQFQVPKHHAAEFLPSVDAAAREAGAAPSQIGFVYVSIGPGSFTGLRIGLACARALALANKAKIIAVPSLQVIAQYALDLNPAPECVAVMLDAKRGNVYGAAFTLADGTYEATSEPAEIAPGAFLADRPRGCAVLGEGLLQPHHRAAAQAAGACILDESLFAPQAEVVYRLGWLGHQRGEFTPPRSLVPAYIRPPESEERWQKRHGTPARNA